MTPTRTLTLAEFLLARIAEDEAAATEARTARDADIARGAFRRGHEPQVPDFEVSWTDDVTGGAVVILGPERVLAECEAKRRIVELHESWPVLAQTPLEIEPVAGSDPSAFALRASQQLAWMTEQEYRARFGDEPPTAPIMAALALPYADHPDYRSEWQPA